MRSFQVPRMSSRASSLTDPYPSIRLLAPLPVQMVLAMESLLITGIFLDSKSIMHELRRPSSSSSWTRFPRA
ncbi:hypothetical protein EXIGLDRAFT_772874 [Exidia glandulosa HHB12029]|uniref:Uncharacterized protein n=1 Tax=Exidia glandulosa HHB12029 TaxID=1314781 RepID=A0A165F2Q5_EXIGL|nr:hypothetical protein EXIGLDRAFT_772874 [Exidia glandulosa HHB12029]